MTLFWLLISILIVGGIARFNQSNRLFWTLLVGLLIGIAGAGLYNRYFDNNYTKDNNNIETVTPTQESNSGSSLDSFLADYLNGIINESEYDSALVSKDIIVDTLNVIVNLKLKSKKITTKPPVRNKKITKYMNSLSPPDG